MPELTIADVELFTGGRLSADSVETYRALQRAYAAVRNYCGWHVSPVRAGDVVTLDGPCSPLLSLPTLQLTALTTVVEDGVTLDVTKLSWSARGLVTKKTGSCWWSCNYRSIVVTMTHGYAVALDFDQAVLSVVNEISSSALTGVGASGAVKRDKVDDTEREWFDSTVAMQAAIGNVSNLLAQYRILPAA
jgi:hypothetical protein